MACNYSTPVLYSIFCRPAILLSMVDVHNSEQRSYNMSRIRSKDTKPERIVRSALHALGFRFTVNGPKNKQLPGKPDIVLPRYKTVIFVHGCFWHGHNRCQYFKLPATRKDWWKNKIEATQARDQEAQRKLVEMGWCVQTIWECQCKDNQKLESMLLSTFSETKA